MRALIEQLREVSELEDAACQDEPDHLFFPPKYNSKGIVERAKKICGECPVQLECLEIALQNNEKYGIWGGKTSNERRRIRRSRRGG